MISWKRWKLGFVVAAIIGFFTACAAAAVLDVKLDLKFYLFFIGLIGKDVILFLQNHPVDQVSFDTTFKPAEEPPEPTNQETKEPK